MLVWPSFGSQKEQEKETECIKCSRKDLSKKKKKMSRKEAILEHFLSLLFHSCKDSWSLEVI